MVRGKFGVIQILRVTPNLARLRFLDHRYRGLIISPLMVLRVDNVSYQGSHGLTIPPIEAIEG